MKYELYGQNLKIVSSLIKISYTCSDSACIKTKMVYNIYSIPLVNKSRVYFIETIV